jgi:hypothetical protein
MVPICWPARLGGSLPPARRERRFVPNMHGEKVLYGGKQEAFFSCITLNSSKGVCRRVVTVKIRATKEASVRAVGGVRIISILC